MIFKLKHAREVKGRYSIISTLSPAASNCPQFDKNPITQL